MDGFLQKLKKVVRIVLYGPFISQSDCRKAGPYQLPSNNTWLIVLISLLCANWLELDSSFFEMSWRAELVAFRIAFTKSSYFRFVNNLTAIKVIFSRWLESNMVNLDRCRGMWLQSKETQELLVSMEYLLFQPPLYARGRINLSLCEKPLNHNSQWCAR